ncbi:MAG: lectin-like protein [Candidatus Hodarchaeales archaeon]
MQKKCLLVIQLSILVLASLHMNGIITSSDILQSNKKEHQIVQTLENPIQLSGIADPFTKVFEDLGIEPQDAVNPSDDYEVLGKLRDNENFYQQVWTPWLSRAAVHVAKVSDDGEFLVIGGGYLLDSELHIYRWNNEERNYVKVWEAGSGIINRDVYDVAFGDSDANNLIEIAAACADGRVYLFEQAHIYDPIANLENRFDFVWKSDNFFQATSVEFDDLDLDGDEDLIVGSWDKKVHIFEYTSHSGYPFDTEHWIELTERWNSTELDEKIQSLGVGDFNNNGLPDFVVGTLSGSIYVFENDGVVLAPHGIEFPFPNDNSYHSIWNNSGSYQPIWNPIGQITTGDLDNIGGTDAVLLAWGQGSWVLHYTDEKDFYLEQLIRAFEDWQTQGAYPFDNFADWMVKDPALNWQIYYQHSNGTKYPEPWSGAAQNEFDILSNSAVTGPPNRNHDGVFYNNHEYLLIPEGKNFNEAKADCEARGGHLVTIEDLAENNFVSSLAGSNRIWIGLTDSEIYGASEGTWKWITGESYGSFTRWNSGEPNNAGNEDFVEMYSNGYWNDLHSGHVKTYVCEWEAWDQNERSTSFYVNSTHNNATGTWNLGAGEELASNGNSDPDLFIVLDNDEAVVQPNEWNISFSNNLIDWHQVNASDITPMTAGKGLAIDIDPMFAKKRMMSVQYVQLTLHTSGSVKERKVDAIIFPYVARPLTIAASVTIDPLSFEYGETNPVNKIVFGGSDGRLLAYHAENVTEIFYYRKFNYNREAEWTGIAAADYGILMPTYAQDWDSYTDDFFNLGETIWSIQGTPKKSSIPSWRYIKDGVNKTKQFAISMPTEFHSLSVYDVESTPGPELLVSPQEPGLGRKIYTYGSEIGNDLGDIFELASINSDSRYNNKGLTIAFGNLYNKSKDEIIVFPWFQGSFRKPDAFDSTLLPTISEFSGGQYVSPVPLTDIDGYLYSYLSQSTTFPSATIEDVNNDSLNDIILSNGRLTILWNVGNATDPSFKFDFDYFKGLNQAAPPNPIFSPNAWDYDQDGDYDLTYSYGYDSSGKVRYGMDFFENQGSQTQPIWIRNAYVMKNPTTDGSLRFNNYTAGVVIPSSTGEQSADSLWVWNGVGEHLRNLIAETDQQNSYIIGTNPELMKLEVNLKQSPPDAVNFGYSMVKSWSNLEELADWTLTLATSYGLDGDNNGEIVVSDYDNNVYVFEHLIENTYKRAYKTHDLNHTETTVDSPYAFQDLPGVPGTFQRTLFDHGNLLATGLDYNENGLEEFVIAASFQVYIYESTGFNDEFNLIFEGDYVNYILDPDVNQFTTLAITSDFDGRGSMLAFGVSNQVFLIRWDPVLGWLESFQSINGGSGLYNIPGNPNYWPDLEIRTMLFADLNQDKKTELWIGGCNRTVTETGFLLALESDFGNIHKIYDFPQISTRINALETSDSDFDGNLELIIAHYDGVDIWEAEKSDDFSFSRTEVISSDPNYANENDLSPTFGTYLSPEGLAPRAHTVLRLESGNYFVVYGIEQSNHDPYSGNEIMQNMSDPLNVNGRLYYAITSDPTDLGLIMDNQNQIFHTPLNVVISEVYYENDIDPTNNSYQWVELYNPNNFDVNITDWRLKFETAYVLLNGTIPARDYYVIAKNESVFSSTWGFSPNYNDSSLDLAVNDALEFKDESLTDIDYVSWGGGLNWNLEANGTTLNRSFEEVALEYERRPLDNNSESNWGNTSTGDPGSGPFGVYDLDYGIEYQPAVTQLDNGTIFITWIHDFNNTNTVHERCVLARNFDETGVPLTEIRVIERRSNPPPPSDFYTQIRGLDAIEIMNGSESIIYVCYTKNDPINPGLSGYSGNLTLKIIQNGVISDKTDSPNLGDYFIHSLDLINVQNRLGIIFAGSPRETFSVAQQLYFTSLNSTFNNQGVFPITSGIGNVQFPSASTMADYTNRIAVLYEEILGGKSEVVSVFSSDSGTTWSDSYILNTDDPYLKQTEESLETENGGVVINRQIYRPRVTDDGTGGITYQFVSRFLVLNGSDINYTGNNFTDSNGDDFNFATQLWIGQIEKGTWFKFNHISDVTSLAIGDSDRDLRNEIFISHDYRVTLLEINQEKDGEISYLQKWQYQPPSFVSLHPELINSTYAEFFASDVVKNREIGAVAIFDGNGNGWPELIFTVRGGDVYSFEVSDLAQPKNDIYAITERDFISNATVTSASDNLLIDVNDDGKLDLIIADGNNGSGILAWDLTGDILLWNYTSLGELGKIYFLNNSDEEPIIVGITSKGVFGVDLDGIQQYWISGDSLNTLNNHAFIDANGDNIADIIAATTDDIRAIDSITGDIIWENIKPDNNTLGYYDLSVGTIGNTKRISVLSSDFSTYTQVNILSSDGTILKSFNLSHITKYDISSRSAIGDFDNDFEFDFAIAIIDVDADKKDLLVYELSTLNLILNETLPVASGLDLSNYVLYARDVNNDNIEDLLLAIPNFESSSNLFPSNGYISAIFAIDVSTESLIWKRYFTNTIDTFKIIPYVDKEVILTFISDSGVFMVSLDGSDVLWTELDPQSESASINANQDGTTYIAVTCLNGTTQIFKVAGMLSKASNIITKIPNYVQTNTKTMYTDISSHEFFIIPVVITNDGAERILLAFKNGTLILRSFDQGEIWRIQISAYSSISACGLEIEPGVFGLAFKTDTSDLYILEKTTTHIRAQITTSGSIVSAYSLYGNSDVILMQTISGNSGELSIYDPIKQTLIWRYISPSYF